MEIKQIDNYYYFFIELKNGKTKVVKISEKQLKRVVLNTYFENKNYGERKEKEILND